MTTTRDFDDWLRDLGMEAHRAALLPAWQEQASRLPAGRPAFLRPEPLTAAGKRIGLSLDQMNAIVDSLAAIDTHPAVGRLAALAQAVTLARRAPSDGSGWAWPLPSRALHPGAQLVYAWAVLGCVDDQLQRNRERGISDDITIAGLQDLGRWIDERRCATGSWMFDRMAWLWNHFGGTLHELGRLQFNCAHWEAPLRILRHRSTRQTVAIMEGRIDLRKDGQWQGVARTPIDPHGFTTSFSEGPDGWQGHPADASGNIKSHPEHFDINEWEEALRRGDPVLIFHIPAGSDLSPASCIDSLKRSGEFFPRHYPKHTFKAWASTSWMFDSQLTHYLSERTNIVRFLRLFRLHPNRDLTGDQIRERVLGDIHADPTRITPTTGLQRAVVAHFLSGRYWKAQGAVLLRDEMENVVATSGLNNLRNA